MMKRWMPGVLVLAVACGGESDPKNSVDVEPEEPEMEEPLNMQEEPQVAALGTCSYANPFSGGMECRGYDDGWSEEQALADCDAQQGEFVDAPCSIEGAIGTCATEVEEAGVATTVAYGEAGACQATGFGCTTFAKGVWEPTALCDGDPPPPTESSVFQPPELICVEPMPGEPEGSGPQGQVCTWQLISGATEEGRKFTDYASCDVVRTQRPYYAYPRPDDAERADARLDDPTYAAEVGWVKSQIEATACVCCHQSSITPDGVSNWDIDQPGNFMNGFYDKGLALGANWINSVALGAFDAEDNNGFDREISGFPSTDPERMKAFFVAELEFRGKSQADFDNSPPFGGPLYDQIFYEPGACPDGVGIAADGTISWEGGDARYVYLLQPGALSPTVPPNLDRPEGTLWKLDVAPDAAAIESGTLKVGEVPVGATQVVPASGMPEFEAGDPVYLYVAADVGIPITRCLLP